MRQQAVRARLLRAALPGPRSLDNAEDGHDALCRDVPAADFQAAVAAAVTEGLIRDPIRLEPGALHCRWVLELTEAGRAAARRLTGD